MPGKWLDPLLLLITGLALLGGGIAHLAHEPRCAGPRAAC